MAQVIPVIVLAISLQARNALEGDELVRPGEDFLPDRRRFHIRRMGFIVNQVLIIVALGVAEILCILAARSGRMSTASDSFVTAASIIGLIMLIAMPVRVVLSGRYGLAEGISRWAAAAWSALRSHDAVGGRIAGLIFWKVAPQLLFIVLFVTTWWWFAAID